MVLFIPDTHSGNVFHHSILDRFQFNFNKNKLVLKGFYDIIKTSTTFPFTTSK